MKANRFRHAAALALMGWYFMVPPPSPARDGTALTGSPLSQWVSFYVFDSANDCVTGGLEIKANFEKELKKDVDIQDAAKAAGRRPSAAEIDNLARDLWAARAGERGECVASDDPRLRK